MFGHADKYFHNVVFVQKSEFYNFFCNLKTPLMSRVLVTGPADQGAIPGQVIPKTQKQYLMPSYLALSIIR